MALDTVIRGGTVVDGSGKARFTGDIGIKDGRIVEIGKVTTPAARTLDADGLIVSPGFIDGHTHMDAQVAWDPLGSCSCWHGVTSVVMSNCGFALAPCKPEDRQWFARCLSAVEDIPTEAMAAGIDWSWETFPEYLSTVERLPKAINYGMYIGHSALRMYVMGRRALSEKATEDDMAAHGRGRAGGAEGRRARLLELARVDPRDAGRYAGGEPHRRMGGDRPHPGGDGRARCRHLPDRARHRAAVRAHRAFLDRLRQVALASRRPIMFGVLATRQGDDPIPWSYQTKYIDDTVAAGGRMFGQGTTRRSTRSSRSSPTCRSTCCRPGGRSAPCRWTSRRGACAIPKCAARWSRPRRR